MLITLAVITTLKARHNEARTAAAFPPQGEILQIDGQDIHVLVKGQGPDLVLIHGASGNLRDFTFSMVDALAHHYRVIVIDRPGLGYSAPMAQPTLKRQAEILQKTAAHLGAERPIVLGQSYGGSVALAWGAYFPETLAALVPVATPSLPWTSALSRYYKITSHPILGPLVIPLLTAWVPDSKVTTELAGVFAPQTVPRGYAEHFGPGLTLRRSALRANALQRAGLLDEIIALQPHLPAITVPIELVHGDADTTVGLQIHSRPLAAMLSQANLTALSGIGHMPHHGAERDVIAAVDRAAQRAALR